MRKHSSRYLISAFLVVLAGFCPAQRARAQAENAPYSVMAPLDQYLIPEESAEIALARSAAPASISDQAEVLVLGRNGYQVAEKGSNGFTCLVERSWAAGADDSNFWNPKVRSPNCFNPAAAKTFVAIERFRAKLALAGKSRTEIAAATASALRNGELPALEPGAMCYMMSKQQYLNDDGKAWHPHLMFYVSGDVEKSWGANLPGSPMIAVNNPEERVTVFMVMVSHWSDGTPGPPIHD